MLSRFGHGCYAATQGLGADVRTETKRPPFGVSAGKSMSCRNPHETHISSIREARGTRKTLQIPLVSAILTTSESTTCCQ